MAESTIYLKNSGIPFSGASVCLAFEGGGMTGTLITDRAGRARIYHVGTGVAHVMVNGQETATISTPDEVDVELLN